MYQKSKQYGAELCFRHIKQESSILIPQVKKRVTNQFLQT